MRLIARRIISVTALFLPIFSGQGLAQSALNPTPYNPSFVKAAFFDNTTFATSRSKSELSSIPQNLIYRIVFRKLQTELDSYPLLTKGDREVISNLPSHEIAEFAVPERVEQTELCQNFDIQKANGNPDLARLTAAYEKSRRESSRILDDHYKDVLSNLSEDARIIIDKIIEEFVGTEKISYSSLNVEGLHRVIPSMARQILENNCDRLALISNIEIPEKEFLIDKTRRANVAGNLAN